MASLSIRKLDDETYSRLQRRAANHGVSMEEEARKILRKAVAPPERLGDFFVETFGAKGGAELTLPPRDPHDPLSFDE
jgi:plasmid stability protein